MKHSEDLLKIVTDLHAKWQQEKVMIVNNYPSWKHENGVEIKEYLNLKTHAFTTSEVAAFEGYVMRDLEDIITQVWMESNSGSAE